MSSSSPTAPSPRGARRRWWLALALWLLAPTAAADEPAAAVDLHERDAVQIAVAQNPGLQLALLELRGAELSVESEEARYPFTLQVESSVTHTESPGSGGSDDVNASNGVQAGIGVSKHLPWGTELSLSLQSSWDVQRNAMAAVNPTVSNGPGYNTAARLSVFQPLLRGFGRDVNEAGLQQATAQKTASEISRDRTASELLRDVLAAYWELWYAQAALDIEQQALDVAQEQLKEATSQRRTGGLAPADLLTFETGVASQQEQLLSAQVEVQNRAVALAELLGRGPYEVGRALDQPALPEPHDLTIRQAVESASPSILDAEQAVAQARIAARSATDQTRPRLDLEGYLQAQGMGNRDLVPMFEQLGTFGAVSAHVGMSYELPLDGTQQRAASAKARLSVEQALTRLEQTRKSVRASVANMLRREETNRRKLELSAVTVKAAEGQLAAATGRLKTGSGTGLAVQQAEQDLRNARLRATRGRIDLLQASIELDHLAGRLLGRYGVTVGSPDAAATTASTP